MKALNNIEQEQFNQVSENVGKILIIAMRELEIPNFIEATFVAGKDTYKLKFEKQKIN